MRSPPRSAVLVIAGGARNEHTCPGEQSKTQRLADIAVASARRSGALVELLDLSRVTARIRPVITMQGLRRDRDAAVSLAVLCSDYARRKVSPTSAMSAKNRSRLVRRASSSGARRTAAGCSVANACGAIAV